jgi:hypothetical protein
MHHSIRSRFRPTRRAGFVRKLVATIAMATVATIGAAGTAGTVGAQEQVCPNLDTGHLSAGNQTSVTITAPPGQVIVQVCVKAGSAQQGEGPEITNFNPGVTSTTISHSSGKEISHFSVKFADAPPPSNGPPTGPGPAAAPGPAPSRAPSAAPGPAPSRAPSAAAPVIGVPRLTG